MRLTTIPALLLAILLALLPAVSASADGVRAVGYVDIQEGTTDQGRVITIELRTAGGGTVASTSYTTFDGDTDEDVAAALVAAFNGFPDHTAKRAKDKASGTEVIYFRKERNGEEFEVVVVTNQSQLTIEVATDYSRLPVLVRSMRLEPSTLDPGPGIAMIELIGTNTRWLDGPPEDVTGLDFGNDILVQNFDILSNTRIVAQIMWSPPGVLQGGGVHVDVEGHHQEDGGTLDGPGGVLNGVTHDVSTSPLNFRFPARAPAISTPGLVVLALLLGAGGIWLLRRRGAAASHQ
jgi:hypothetical protein